MPAPRAARPAPSGEVARPRARAPLRARCYAQRVGNRRRVALLAMAMLAATATALAESGPDPSLAPDGGEPPDDDDDDPATPAAGGDGDGGARAAEFEGDVLTDAA